jgi:UDP-2,3-diacylglucosamine pyrophosphatase LpxH
MTESASHTAGLLRSCEKSGLAPAYGEPEVRVDSLGGEIFVVSDLHLSAGRRQDGTYSGCENFFCDQSFGRFLRHAHAGLEPGGPRALLVINGDFIDFLRVSETPARKEEFAAWEKLIREIGAEPGRTGDELETLIAEEKKQGYGLRTHDYKSAWKLSRVVEGHPAFFDALAEWLGRGHRLVVVKGNHDLEWYWPAVRNCFRLALAERLAGQSGESVEAALTKTILPNITFADHSIVIDGNLYMEHGHRYDAYSRVLDEPTVNNGEELNIPFGSFFNRYLLNKIEVHYPFLDNVRPRENLLPLLIRERFPLALKVVFHHIPFALKLIPKRQFRYIFRRVIWVLLAVAAPVALVIYLQWNTVESWLSTPKAAQQAATPLGDMLGKGLEVVKNFGFLILSYFFSRFVAYFQLVEPDSLSKDARKAFSANSKYGLITFGHTHNPDQFEQDDRWFYNTGTWIPILEVSSADVRNDKTYTYLHIRPGPAGANYDSALKRWNDDGARADALVVINKS